MSKVFVVSDTWFNRPMDDDPNTNIVDYNDSIIQNWNNTVKMDDDVYVLGGFGISDLYHILIRLNGRIHFLDNYYIDDEKSFITQMKREIMNSSTPDLLDRIIFEKKQIMSLNKLDVILSYFPLSDWFGKKNGTFCFHGLNENMNLTEHDISCMMNKWENTPIDIENVKENILAFENDL